ncbi:MAG: UDP-N-acetylmuramoyl-L-alanyl-D-glutamate--2,6-diaminopimelate ligase, partial [Rickettsiales bacterium]|nr:UDP-N-acetylmuramoyl-L-alanyl-D-glutamate--2,6-diaminopimelate ligase [Rickettsiales bacterium]
MKLSELVKSAKNPDLEISGITNNSKNVRPGYMFVAIKGYRVDGADFIPDAIRNGAVAVVTQGGFQGGGVEVIRVGNPRATASAIAARFYPNSLGFICAVTGTNGKSSTVNFTRQMWEFLGIKSASIGTVGIKTNGEVSDKSLTTPDAIDLNRALNKLAREGARNVVIETSSHGIEQYRADNIRIMAAGFTNISNDHLDYYRDIDEYFRAKLRLFSELLDEKGTAVVNADDPRGAEVAAVCRSRGIRVLTYGKGESADIRLAGYSIRDWVQDVALDVCGRRYDLRLNLITEFQVYNMMCALGLFMAGGGDVESLVPHLGGLKNEAGRIEFVGQAPSGARIFLDFGHNGDGIKRLMTDFRPYVDKNLICVIGSSGDRPEIRRIEIGRVLNECADEVIITDDNPRTEDPAAIRETLHRHCPRARVIPNRWDAISEVIDASRPWDSILICGTMYEKDRRFIRDKLSDRPAVVQGVEVSGVFEHSDLVIPGSAFVGIKGFTEDGADFSAAAVEKGAKVLVVANDYAFGAKAEKLIEDKGVKVVRVGNTRKAFADWVYDFYGRRQPENFVAVTGTSGKSSCVDFVRQIWSLMGKKALSSGTIGIIVENVYSKRRIIQMGHGHYTTPVGGELYKYLAYYRDLGVEGGAIELSSHGLDQLRAENIRIVAGGFTNLGIDHADFYGGGARYLESKARLFREVIADGGTAVLNADIPEYGYLRDICGGRGLRVFSYGMKGRELRILSQDSFLTGQTASVELFGKRHDLDLKILGEFQLYNLLCAIGLVAANTPGWEEAVPRLGEIRNALGRMEFMGKTKGGALVYIDFAYKSEALDHTLATLRAMTGGKLIAVFSTCGDILETRRRRELGEVAQRMADIAIVTDDSPRHEDAAAIRAEIIRHCPKGIDIKDGRRAAIRYAMSVAGEGDVILIAGKGHED